MALLFFWIMGTIISHDITAKGEKFGYVDCWVGSFENERSNLNGERVDNFCFEYLYVQ